MLHRNIVSPSTLIGIVLSLSLLVAVACGGTTTAPADPGSGTGSAAPAEATAVPAAPSEPESTPTPLPAALPSEVIANPITKDAYSDAIPGGILRRGGYFDPAHYDLMQVSSVSNSFKQMMLLNNPPTLQPPGRRQDHHPRHRHQLGRVGRRQGVDLPPA